MMAYSGWPNSKTGKYQSRHCGRRYKEPIISYVNVDPDKNIIHHRRISNFLGLTKMYSEDKHNSIIRFMKEV